MPDVRTHPSSTRQGSNLDRTEGRVRWFSTAKGYGFISTADDGDVFVRYGDIHMDGFKCLEAGQLVHFVSSTDEHGPIALDVRVH